MLLRRIGLVVVVSFAPLVIGCTSILGSFSDGPLEDGSAPMTDAAAPPTDGAALKHDGSIRDTGADTGKRDAHALPDARGDVHLFPDAKKPPPMDSGHDAAEPCKDGLTECPDVDAGTGTVLTCTGGDWVPSTCPTSSPFCASGACAACAPGQRQCDSSGTTLECAPTGTWGDAGAASCSTEGPGTCEGSSCIITLATSARPYAITIDSANVYWTDTTSKSVMQVAITGGSVVTLATAAANGLQLPISVTVGDSSVYWADPGTGDIQRAPIGGGAVVSVAHGSYPSSVAFANDTVFFTDSTVGSINGIATAAGSSQFVIVAGETNAQQIAADSANLYWTTYGAAGTAKFMSQAGSTPTSVGTNLAYPIGIAVGGQNIYWANYAGGSGIGTVESFNYIGGGGSTLADDQAGPQFVAVSPDGQSIYWTDSASPGGVVRSQGGVLSTLTSLSTALGIAVDATSVYFADGSGAVKKITPR
jgi:hypothetical protein